MAQKDDKWVMFKNYMHNELGITKEDIREWINDSVKEEARKIVQETFARENPEQLIRRVIYESNCLYGPSFKQSVIRETALILAEHIELTIKNK